MSLKTGLTMHGFQVETAKSGQAALDLSKSGLKPGLILTDVNMPIMGGLELIGKIRALPGFRFLPALPPGRHRWPGH
jgi:two-component system chemotaxis response regulator CheY